MPKITSVEKQKTLRLRSGRKRFNIYLDGVFAFGADEDLVVNFRLIPGKEIQPADLEKILFEAQVGKLMERMYGLFSIRQRSEKEVRNYFKVKNRRASFVIPAKAGIHKTNQPQEEISEIVIESLIQKLKDKGLINDLEFAKAWVESRRKSKQKGKIALKFELIQKGIDKEIIEEVISQQPSDFSEADMATQALEKKLKSWKNLDFLKLKQKSFAYLGRKGFDYESIKKAIDKLSKKE